MMAGIAVQLTFSESVDDTDRITIEQTFIDEGFDTSRAANDISYKRAGFQPENLLITLVLKEPVRGFLLGFGGAAGADAWEACKRALKRVRVAHTDIGQEAVMSDDERNVHVRYILPGNPDQTKIAVDAIKDDFASLDRSDERWWLGPPESRWGTGMEAREHGSK